MNHEEIYPVVLLAILLLGGFTLYGTVNNLSPYGRLKAADAKAWSLPSSWAWLLFESPQLFAFALTFWWTAAHPSPTAVWLFALWQTHYLYRGLIYPLRRNDQGKRFPLLNVLFGFLFNLMNGYANGYAVAHAGHLATLAWLTTPWFIGGLMMAATGWWINFQADNRLIDLRRDGSTGYKIPYGGCFRYVSAANYFGEILLWSGWALMTLTWASGVFVLFTLANLVPRALISHRWYRTQFPDYPAQRRAIIPFLL
ncbi:MAG: DUF1295 domain-containing protein [Sterolibacterium sp.]|jgi:3-oxo-5-alpha-steroid 4-dehydrogenase 1|nr:DUF1295 domain-containing protein [Sterolibacterium sp.]